MHALFAGFGRVFGRFARLATNWTGSTTAFILATLIVVGWAAVGPYYEYSNTWQLVINTGTTIVTFLMVFLIQRAQNRDSAAVQLKLNELIAAVKGASNRLIAIEELSEDELQALRDRYRTLATLTQADALPGKRHSVEDVAAVATAEATKVATAAATGAAAAAATAAVHAVLHPDKV